MNYMSVDVIMTTYDKTTKIRCMEYMYLFHIFHLNYVISGKNPTLITPVLLTLIPAANRVLGQDVTDACL